MARNTVDSRREELRSRIASMAGAQSASAVSRRKKLVDDLLVLDVGAADVRDCLSAQRASLDSEPRLSKLPHVSPRLLEERMGSKPAGRFYLMSRAFSLPEDYRSLPDGPCPRSWEDRAVLACVVHPEKIPYELLAALGLVPPDREGPDRHSRYVAELRAKIAAIPEFKRLVASSEPFAGSSRSRGRAVALVSPGNPADGMVLAFHSSTGRWPDDRTPSRTTTATAYPDAYAYLRSRYYAEGFLEERELALRRSANALAGLLVRYAGGTGEGVDVAKIRTSLESRKTFFEQRAYVDRLLAVRGRNRSQDLLRIKGAMNDVQKAFLDRVGKRSSVAMQAAAAESAIETEAAAWKSAYRALRVLVSPGPDSPAASERASGALGILSRYRLSSSGFRVRPFSVVRSGLEEAEHALFQAHSAGNSADVASALGKLDTTLRAQAFLLFRYGLEHSFKTDSLTEGGRSEERLSDVLERKFARIESMVFAGLPESVAKKGAFRRFQDVMDELREMNASGNSAIAAKFLESLRRGR